MGNGIGKHSRRQSGCLANREQFNRRGARKVPKGNFDACRPEKQMSDSIAELFQRLTLGVYVVGVADGEARNAFTAA